jgi:hypothetical protein
MKRVLSRAGIGSGTFSSHFFSARHTIYDLRAAIREPLRAESQLAHSQTHSDSTFQSAKHKKVLNFLWLNVGDFVVKWSLCS